MTKFCIISYLYGPNTSFNDSRLVGQLHISTKYENLDHLYRQVLDFCYAKDKILKIPDDIIFFSKEEDLIKLIYDGLRYIFQNIECEENNMIEFWKNRYTVANIKEVP